MYTTIEAKIDHGQIIPSEPEALPENGKLLLTVISASSKKPDIGKLRKLMGSIQMTVDPSEWQRESRNEWNHRP